MNEETERLQDEAAMLRELLLQMARDPAGVPMRLLKVGMRLTRSTAGAVVVGEEPVAVLPPEAGDTVGLLGSLGTPSCVSISVGPGTLRLGRSLPFQPEETCRLELLGRAAATALEAAGAFTRERSRRQTSERETAWLRSRVEGLASLQELPALRALDPQALLNGLGEELQRLIPHQSRCYTQADRLDWMGCAPAWQDELQSIARAVLEHHRALWLQATESQPGLLAVPVSTSGVLCLAGSGFTSEHLDLLRVVAPQMGAALENARLHRQLQETHEQLKRSQAELLQASKLAAVGQLAAGVAHEMNNPLGAVVLATDMACRVWEKNPVLVPQLLQDALTGARRARGIVEKLLHYSRRGTGETRRVGLEDIVADTLSLFRRALDEDGIQLELDFQPAPIRGNAAELEQVVANLLLNARDALRTSGEEPRRLWIRTRTRVDRSELEVEDSGPGVPEEVRERIFEPFFTTRPVGQGTGLGLSISREIVARHGGSLTLGSGSVFRVSLPHCAG
ncbi:MAG: ATP-binding protein [Candidatus Eremiobacterota bacterium]